MRAFSDVTVPVRHEPPMVRCISWRPGSIGTKIEVFAGRRDRTTVEHRAVAEVRRATDRGLRECERTYRRESRHQTDGCKSHFAYPSNRERNEDRRVWLQFAIRRETRTFVRRANVPRASLAGGQARCGAARLKSS